MFQIWIGMDETDREVLGVWDSHRPAARAIQALYQEGPTKWVCQEFWRVRDPQTEPAHGDGYYLMTEDSTESHENILASLFPMWLEGCVAEHLAWSLCAHEWVVEMNNFVATKPKAPWLMKILAHDLQRLCEAMNAGTTLASYDFWVGRDAEDD